MRAMSRIFTIPFASVYPHYVAKAEKKLKAEVDKYTDSFVKGADKK